MLLYASGTKGGVAVKVTAPMQHISCARLQLLMVRADVMKYSISRHGCCARQAAIHSWDE